MGESVERRENRDIAGEIASIIAAMKAREQHGIPAACIVRVAPGLLSRVLGAASR